MMPVNLTHEDFARHLNETFDIGLGDGSFFSIELIEVRVLGSGPEDPDMRHAFSIVFRGPSEPVLSQQIYRVVHKKMGPLDIFLVPIGPDLSAGMRYEAVFA